MKRRAPHIGLAIKNKNERTIMLMFSILLLLTFFYNVNRDGFLITRSMILNESSTSDSYLTSEETNGITLVHLLNEHFKTLHSELKYHLFYSSDLEHDYTEQLMILEFIFLLGLFVYGLRKWFIKIHQCIPRLNLAYFTHRKDGKKRRDYFFPILNII